MKHDWKYKRLGDVLLFDKRFNGLPQREQEKVVKFSHVSAEKLKELYVENGDVHLISTGNYDGTTTIENAGENLSKGEIITIPTGGVANIKYYNGYFVDSGNIIAVSSDPTNWMRYIFYAMIANKDTINSFYRGVSIKHPYMPDIYNITIPVPPLPIQKQIVSLLDKMNRVIEAKKEQLKELDNLAQAIFYDMFGDPVTNDKGWGVKKLDDVAFVKIGPFGSLLHKNDYIKGGVPLVNPIHMKDGRIYPDYSFTISIDKKKEMSAYLLKKGDVIFARRGEIGRCAIVSEKEDGFLCGTGSLFVRFTEPISEVFVLYWAKSESFVKDLVSKAKGATMLNINCNIVGNLLLPIPPLELQKKFSEKVEAIEQQKELINQSIKDVQTLFDAKMDYYFGD